MILREVICFNTFLCLCGHVKRDTSSINFLIYPGKLLKLSFPIQSSILGLLKSFYIWPFIFPRLVKFECMILVWSMVILFTECKFPLLEDCWIFLHGIGLSFVADSRETIMHTWKEYSWWHQFWSWWSKIVAMFLSSIPMNAARISILWKIITNLENFVDFLHSGW